MKSYDWLWPGPYLGILRPWAQENVPPPSLFVRIQLCVSKNNNKNWQKTKHYSVSQRGEAYRTKCMDYAGSQ
jgi:hypothetical protein